MNHLYAYMVAKLLATNQLQMPEASDKNTKLGSGAVYTREHQTYQPQYHMYVLLMDILLHPRVSNRIT